METGSYIDGKWIHPKSNRLVRNINPADPDDVIAEFPAALAEDVQRAIDAAQAAFRSWKNTPGPERGRVLWRAADIARRRADEIARTLTREEGKILKEAKGEVMKGISLLEFYAGEGFRMHGKTLPSEARDTFTYTIRRPLGVVGLIAPWNFPWAIPVWKSAPALAAGNCVIFKPAELTPATAALLTEIYQEAGCPPGVFNMVVGSGSVVGEAIVHSPVIRAVSFTGSNEIGGVLWVQSYQPLGFAGVVYKDRFQLGEEIESFLGHLAFADAGGFGAAERQLSLATDGRLVDMDHTGFDFFDEAQDGVDVFRENRSGEAVLDTIREGERFFQIFCGGYRQHRPEDLFFEDPHLRIDIVKDGRFDEIAFAEMCRLFAAQNQPCAFVLSNLDVVEIGFPLFLIDGGAHIDRFIQTRPDFNFFCGLDETIAQRVLHLGMSDHA